MYFQVSHDFIRHWETLEGTGRGQNFQTSIVVSVLVLRLYYRYIAWLGHGLQGKEIHSGWGSHPNGATRIVVEFCYQWTLDIWQRFRLSSRPRRELLLHVAETFTSRWWSTRATLTNEICSGFPQAQPKIISTKSHSVLWWCLESASASLEATELVHLQSNMSMMGLGVPDFHIYNQLLSALLFYGIDFMEYF